MTWTREHDRVLAEKCEGLRMMTGAEVQASGPWCEMHYESGEASWWLIEDNYYEIKDGTRGEKKEPCLLVWPVAEYNLDIDACIRAAEAWRTNDPNYRRYSIESRLQEVGTFDARVSDLGDAGVSVAVKATTPAAALAEALYMAVTA